MDPAQPVLVVCDLDSTLFEPHRFCLDASTRRAFDPLERHHVPLVLSSTRTRVELELMQRELGIHQPFICECGGALFTPRGYFGAAFPQAVDVAGYEAVELGKPYGDLADALHRIADQVQTEVVGFDDMSVDEVAATSGVPLLQARLAKLREYSEAFRIVDPSPDARARLLKALRSAGLDCTVRGRYHYLHARHGQRAWAIVRSLYQRLLGRFVSIVLCDSGADGRLLREADIPMLLQTTTSGADQVPAALSAARLSGVRSVGACAETILAVVESVRGRRPNAPTYQTAGQTP